MWEWAVLILLVLGVAAGIWWRMRPRALPDDWPLLPRPLFSGQEEQVYEWLCQSFPEYLVLAKVPLARFMRLKRGEDPAVWFPLINPLHVSFVVCSPKGYVLGAVDLPGEATASQSAGLLKQRALKVCGIRYLSITGRALPSSATLRSLLLAAQAEDDDFKHSAFGDLDAARARLDETIKSKRTERWSADSMISADSFLHGDSRPNASVNNLSA
jgi:hypothetical protein